MTAELTEQLREYARTDTAQTVVKDALSRLSAGANHNCHVVNDGTVRCSRSNSDRQLGDGTTTLRRAPVFVTPDSNPTGRLTGVVAVTSGSFHSCALKSDGTVHCWRSNRVGHLGDGTTTQRLRAVPVPGIANAVRIAGGSAHTCALLADSTGRVRTNAASRFSAKGVDLVTERIHSIRPIDGNDGHVGALLDQN